MRTVRDIYEEYKIPPGLQVHQLRVAAVAAYVCDYFDNTVDKEKIVLAGLFHDMGNIIKSDISLLPDLFQPEGVEYWQKVRSAFIEKYGENEHDATQAIGRDIGLSPDIQTLIGSGGFSKLEHIVTEGSEELKIFQYGDSRVGPHGVLSLEKRFREGRERAAHRHVAAHAFSNDDRFEYLLEKGKELEQQLVSYAHFDPQEITDESIAPMVKELSEYQIA